MKSLLLSSRSLLKLFKKFSLNFVAQILCLFNILPRFVVFSSRKPTCELEIETINRDDVQLLAEHNGSAKNIPVEKLIGWTINETEEMESLIRLGIHGIMSDRPNLLYRAASRLDVV